MSEVHFFSHSLADLIISYFVAFKILVCSNLEVPIQLVEDHTVHTHRVTA